MDETAAQAKARERAGRRRGKLERQRIRDERAAAKAEASRQALKARTSPRPHDASPASPAGANAANAERLPHTDNGHTSPRSPVSSRSPVSPLSPLSPRNPHAFTSLGAEARAAAVAAHNAAVEAAQERALALRLAAVAERAALGVGEVARAQVAEEYAKRRHEDAAARAV